MLPTRSDISAASGLAAHELSDVASEYGNQKLGWWW